jgi:hypothetical protein
MALNEQTEMAFGDQPPRTDPVSGNEVPPGALPSEVRDDIPARLSEGEYVVPADVLQFFGIKFFEDLRTKAKTELAELEEGGRMGGEPMPMEGQEELPFSLDELQKYSDEDDSMVANEGGMVSGFNEGGLTDSATPNFPAGASSVFTMPTTVFKTFVNEAGLRMYIRFVSGVPMSPIPTGYTEEGVASETSAPVQTPVAREEGENRSQEAIDLENSPFVKPFEIMTKAELARFAAEISKTKIYNAITGVPGMIGFGAKAQEKRWSDYVSKVNDMGTKGQKDFVNGLQTNIDAGDRDANIAIAKVNNGGKDVTHLDIMTGDVGYLKKTRVSNIGISDADMLEDLAGGSSTSDDGTPPYIPIDYSDDVLSADFVGDDADDDDAESTAELRERLEQEKAARKKAAEADIAEAKRKREEENNNDNNKEEEEAAAGGYNVGDTSEITSAGGRFMNKGGLATRKKKKK